MSPPPTPRAAAPASAPPHTVALWQQLLATAGALQAVRAGQSGTTALAAVQASLRPGVQALLFQVLRQAGRAEALRRRMVARTPPPAADALLCTALALCWDPEASPYEPFTLVNQAVEAAKRSAATARRLRSSTAACGGFCASAMPWCSTRMATRWHAGTTLPGGWPACARTIPRTGSRSCGPTTRMLP